MTEKFYLKEVCGEYKFYEEGDAFPLTEKQILNKLNENEHLKEENRGLKHKLNDFKHEIHRLKHELKQWTMDTDMMLNNQLRGENEQLKSDIEDCNKKYRKYFNKYIELQKKNNKENIHKSPYLIKM